MVKRTPHHFFKERINNGALGFDYLAKVYLAKMEKANEDDFFRQFLF
jgi:hypothetical protein